MKIFNKQYKGVLIFLIYMVTVTITDRKGNLCAYAANRK